MNCLILLLALVSAPAPASARPARVVKVALLVGNNRGEPGEVQLLFAHEDARRLAAILRRHGGFRAEDVTLVLEGSADDVRGALVTLNDRIRTVTGDGREVLLFVYYSGHADAEHLHLGDSLMPLDELRKLVRGSAARFRVLVLDSCKSGSLTRVKGGRPVVPFEVDMHNELDSEGTVVITSSAFDEDAQESDRYRGSLFTHHFSSGLLGAADLTGDGQVSLMEAYRYAYQQTIKTTSRTWAGTQHPTYQYDIKGKGDIVLTTLTLDRRDKASLVFSRAGTFLLMRADEDGPVVAEVTSDRAGRRLVLEPGRYFIRERSRDELREGTFELHPGREHDIAGWQFERIAYARLVRKGGGVRSLAHGPLLTYRLRGEILHAMGPMHLFGAGYPLSLRWLTLTPRLTFGRASAANDNLRSTTTELDLVLELVYPLDLSIFTLAAGLELGGVYLGQRFRTGGEAPDRDQFGLLFGGVATVSVHVVQGFYLQLSAEALSYLFYRRDEDGKSTLETPLTWVFGVSAGIDF